LSGGSEVSGRDFFLNHHTLSLLFPAGVDLLRVWRTSVKTLLLFLILALTTVHAQTRDPLEGLWQGYDGEWGHVSRQLVALAEAIPADKYGWRPGPGVRSTGEVLMHISEANFWLLSQTGQKMPSDFPGTGADKIATDKAKVIDWLKRSLEAVRQAHASETPDDLARKIAVEKHPATVDGVYLRILVHDNAHMGQLVAYARMNGIVPPWSK
jgi:uncharacterized damage-inducible protein DinB